VRLIFSVLTAIVVIGAAIFFIGPLFISTDDVRDKVLAQVESATGYRLRIGGPVQFSLFPSLDLVAQDVGVAQGDSPDEIATAQKLRFGLVWSALWSGKVRMTELTLIDPVIAVPQTQGGSKANQRADGGNGAESKGSSLADTLRRLSLDKLSIKNGTVILPPSGSTPGKRIEALNLEASLPAVDDPLAFDASGLFDEKTMRVAGSIGAFGRFLEGAASPVSLAVEAPATLAHKATLSGTATYQDDTLTLKQFSAGMGDHSITGDATYKGSILTLHPLTAKTGGNTLSGALAADLSGKVPAVNAALTADTLNLDSFHPAKRAAQKADAAGGFGGGSGAASRSGWSDAPVDFSPLRSVNGKLKLTAGKVIYSGITISAATIDATLSGGKLNAELPGFKLYNGMGAASVAVDASGGTPAQRVRLALSNLDAYPFLKDATGFQNIEGTGAVTLDLSASGASQRAIVAGLNGTTKFEFTNGAIRGINIAKTVRNLTSGIVTGWQESGSEKTDFAALGASFKVAKGVAQTDDLHLAGPLVRVTGTGSVDLPAQALKFRVNPQMVASLEGQGGTADLQGLGVPVMIAGPWARPKIYPDIEGILQNPVAAYEQLNKLGGLIKLPGIDQLGGAGATGSVPGVAGIVKDGKINKDALRQGLGQILGKQNKPEAADGTLVAPAAAPAAAPATQATEDETQGAPPTKKEQKKKQRAEREEAAKQLFQNLLGN
jgi:AsmA protein